MSERAINFVASQECYEVFTSYIDQIRGELVAIGFLEKGSNLIRIIFWNVNNKDLSGLVSLLALQTSADVVVLNENSVASDTTLRELKATVSTDFFIPNSMSEKRFHCFSRESKLDMSEIHNGFRTNVRKLHYGNHQILLMLVHGVDMRNYDSESRQSFAQSLSSDIRLIKEQQGTDKVLLLGDFNMNPYERGMNLAAGLNAMMTKECVKQGVRRHLGENYDLFYNPMWSLFGDLTVGPAGTVYDTSNQGAYGWNMLDQVVIHHSIVELFKEVKILTSAGDHLLIDDRGRPDSKMASDHLPILVTLKENTDE